MHDVNLADNAATLRRKANLGMTEFVAMCASLAAVAAMSIDIILPALPAIGRAFGIADENIRQLVILIFVVTFAVSQAFYGPLSDRFGRKPLIAVGLSLYLVGSFSAMFVTDFSWLLGMRMVQGVGAAALQVVTLAIIRDCFAGPAMGRVLTFVFTTFMIIPIIAPTIGQQIEFIATWKGIFAFNAIAGVMIFVWMATRLRETLDVEDRRSLAFGSLLEALVEICTNRVTAGYAVASTLTLIGLFSYIVSVQQVYGELYGLGTLFPYAFGGSSIGVALAALFSARLVRLMGMRPVAHGALAIFTVSGLLLFLLALGGNPPFWVTFGLLSICMMAFGVLQGNISAIALEPLGHIAGTASSLFGVVTTTIATVLAGVVGQAYDGTVVPLAFAFGFGGLFATLAVLWTERGRMFRNGASSTRQTPSSSFH
ncbi:multidrug effflux MFS transporter [Rhizobium sp. TH2]|uniref:multidrug effflux MFS transporter n=1 Tax=Rhizobium sp. TH2 TaxID=2775403 RepID=UPI00215885F2|nr:multidrug effflux MFS transporter [Rhizobium sp. TH2]UVC10791.1 multidrug effflux MFS transporter [Rhizobium sp. TH2]